MKDDRGPGLLKRYTAEVVEIYNHALMILNVYPQPSIILSDFGIDIGVIYRDDETCYN